MKNQFSSERIFLIGYMGSGKSTVGALLAEHLGFHFIDTDVAISQLQGNSVAEIFSQDGEDHFRSRESAFLKFVTELDQVVIATGGGMVMSPDNVNTMLDTGLTIFLDCEPQILKSRISQSSINRPLHNDSKEDLLSAITQKLEVRRQYYREAHMIIQNNSSNPYKALEQIMARQ